MRPPREPSCKSSGTWLRTHAPTSSPQAFQASLSAGRGREQVFWLYMVLSAGPQVIHHHKVRGTLSLPYAPKWDSRTPASCPGQLRTSSINFARCWFDIMTAERAQRSAEKFNKNKLTGIKRRASEANILNGVNSHPSLPLYNSVTDVYSYKTSLYSCYIINVC